MAKNHRSLASLGRAQTVKDLGSAKRARERMLKGDLYPGKLGEPIPLIGDDGDHRRHPREAEWERAFAEQEARLPLLAEYLGVPPNADPTDKWYFVSLRLACIHVRGFQIVRRLPKVGRPPKAKADKEAEARELVRAVDERAALSGRTNKRISSACADITGRGGHKSHSRERRYYKSRKVLGLSPPTKK